MLTVYPCLECLRLRQARHGSSHILPLDRFKRSFDRSFTRRSSSTRYRRPPSLRCLKYALCRPPWLFLFLNSYFRYSRVKTIQTKDPTPTPRSSYPASALSRRPLRLRALSLSNTPSAPAAAPLRVHNLLALSTSSPAPLPTRAGFLNRAVAPIAEQRYGVPKESSKVGEVVKPTRGCARVGMEEPAVNARHE